MYDFKRIMTALDFSSIDETLVKYTGFISRLTSPAKIYFVHVERELDIPDTMRDEFPQLALPHDERLEEKMKLEVLKHYNFPASQDVSYEVVEGSPLDKLMHMADVKGADLVVVGRKKEEEGSGIVAQRLSRKAAASILFLPENAGTTLDTILVATDFSEYSARAIEEAVKLARQSRSARVICLHIYHVPPQYYKTGKSYEEFDVIMRGHAERRYQEFIKEIELHDTVVEPVFMLENSAKPYELIIAEAKKQNAGLIIVGAKGRTVASALLLGSMTEKLIRHYFDIPLLIVKDKRTMSWREVLESI